MEVGGVDGKEKRLNWGRNPGEEGTGPQQGLRGEGRGEEEPDSRNLKENA